MGVDKSGVTPLFNDVRGVTRAIRGILRQPAI